MRILNQTAWKSADLRRIIRRVATDMRVDRQSLNRLVAAVGHRAVNRKALERCAPVRPSPQYSKARPRIVLRLPTFPTLMKDRMVDGSPSRGTVGQRVEQAFWASGLIAGRTRYLQAASYWEKRLQGLPLTWEPQTTPKITTDVRAERGLRHATRMVKRWERRLKRAETGLKTWAKRARYYEKRLQELRKTDDAA